MQTGWRSWGTAEHTVRLIQADTPFDIRVTIHGSDSFTIDGALLTAASTDDGLRLTTPAGRVASLGVTDDGSVITVFDNGTVTQFTRVDGG